MAGDTFYGGDANLFVDNDVLKGNLLLCDAQGNRLLQHDRVDVLDGHLELLHRHRNLKQDSATREE